MTWMVRYPMLIALITHATVFWETFYCVLIWPRWTRPLMLIMAVFVHGGIALFLGMPTFGTAMLIGNLAFISPKTIDGMVQSSLAVLSRAKMHDNATAGDSSVKLSAPIKTRIGASAFAGSKTA